MSHIDYIYVILDTNVIVSGMLMGKGDRKTPPQKVLDMALDGKLKLFYSQEIFQEYQEVLTRRKFHFSGHQVKKVLNGIKDWGIEIVPQRSSLRLEDATDQPFFDLVTSKNTPPAVLVTGNSKHFPKQPYVMSPVDFWEWLAEKDLDI